MAAISVSHKIQSFNPLPYAHTCAVFVIDFFFYFVYDHIVPQVSLATFAIYVLLGNELTATKTFVAISLFNILRFPLMMLPHVVTSAIQVCLGTQLSGIHGMVEGPVTFVCFVCSEGVWKGLDSFRTTCCCCCCCFLFYWGGRGLHFRGLQNMIVPQFSNFAA